MASKISHGISLSEDRRAVTMHIATDTVALSVDLDAADVDLLIDALTEMREHMTGSAETSN